MISFFSEKENLARDGIYANKEKILKELICIKGTHGMVQLRELNHVMGGRRYNCTSLISDSHCGLLHVPSCRYRT